MRLIFMGTPAFAVPALKALIDHGYNVVAVYTQPPRPKDRGHHITKSPVHRVAEEHTIPVYTPSHLKSLDAQEMFAAHKADLAIVAAYGLILPEVILETPQYGCLNIHGSLLPRWRGAAPIHRALLAGDRVTGITLMQMDAGLDTGDMLCTAEYPLTEESTFETVHDALSLLGAELLIKALPDFEAGKLKAQKQPLEGITYAHKLSKEEGHIDWKQPASSILRQIRALNPWPGTYTYYHGHNLKIKAASLLRDEKEALPPGTIRPQGCVVCGDGCVISLDILQREGGKTLTKDAFLRGFDLIAGETFSYCR